jgi:hypothetical protein
VKFGTQTRAVVRVGDGRGFIVEAERERWVYSAAHCLPWLPPRPDEDGARAIGSLGEPHEKTYAELLGSLGGATTVWTECVFCDPISDVAVLGKPHDDNRFELTEQYWKLIDDDIVPLRVAGLTDRETAWMLSLDLRWFRCRAAPTGAGLWVSDCEECIEAGMSGSPILNDAGHAIGLVSVSSVNCRAADTNSMNPALARSLPRWLCPLVRNKRALSAKDTA